MEGPLRLILSRCARDGTGKGKSVGRLAMALAAFAVLGVLTWSTLTDPTLRVVTLTILALFAAKTWLHRKEMMHPDKTDDTD